MEHSSITRAVFVFLGFILLAQVVLTALAFAFPGLTIPSFVNLLVVLFSAMAAGRSFADAHGVLPTGGQKSAFAAIATVGTVGLNLGFVAGLLVYYGAPVTVQTMIFAMTGGNMDLAGMQGALLAGVVVGLLIGFALAHTGFGSGAKRALKARRPA